MRWILTPVGSAGDVFPFIALGRRLREAGHEVTLVTAQIFADAVRGAGLDFVGVGNEAELERIMRDPRIWQMGWGTKAVFEHSAGVAGEYLEAIRSVVEDDREPARLLGSVLAFGARLAREALGLPLVTVHLQPAVMVSAYEPPLVLPALDRLLRVLPVRVRRWLFDHGPNPLDFFAGRRLRDEARHLGVRPPRSFFREWWDSPDGVMVLFPEWWAAPQPDWPQPLLQMPFPLEDLAQDAVLAPEVEAFLACHEAAPPVLLTAGSANVQAQAFFAEGVAALKQLGRAGLLLTREPDQLLQPLPPEMLAVTYAPFSQLLPRCAAMVHHGGIGTLSQALAAGVPQLVVPMAHDQPDNARRLERLGVGFLWAFA
ncbi:MAG: glycosyltransferase family 1 protein [Verrucomicrobiales bacterium]|nr:glycosyltransferase family 1 protein [Verrucomicrobiales bacterium]